jgi:DNA-directed RNA polymerase alpha subunit
MELKEFLIKFLPDYEAKLTEVKGDTNDEKVIQYLFWQQKHFPEALQNFADRTELTNIDEIYTGRNIEINEDFIDKSGVSTRAKNFLREYDGYFAHELTEWHFSRCRNCGKKTLQEIREYFSKIGMPLKKSL